MLVIFAVIIGGIIAGRLLSSWRLVFVSRMITVIIWLLLFLLGLEVGSDPAVVGGMATLGRTAFVIFACSVAGSICMSWLLWRCVRRGTASRPPAEGMPEQAGAVAAGIEAPQPRVTTSAGTGMPGPAVAVECPGQNAGRVAGEHVVSGADAALSMWGALRGSLVIVAFFVAGCVAGLFAPFDMTGSCMSAYVLYALMFCVGVTLGNDREKPLALYYFGPEKTGREVLLHTSSGGACINDTIMQIANDRLPFGGVGNSGMGRYHGRDSFDAFSHRRAVVETPTWIDPPFRYMPYKLFRYVKRIL